MNLRFEQCFNRITCLDVFVASARCGWIYALIARDEESGETTLQLLLDGFKGCAMGQKEQNAMDKRYVEIGQRLQKAREHRGLSVEELAERVTEYSTEEIRQFEAGECELDVNAFVALCLALETDMEWLLHGISTKERHGVESVFATYYGEDDSEPAKQ